MLKRCNRDGEHGLEIGGSEVLIVGLMCWVAGGVVLELAEEGCDNLIAGSTDGSVLGGVESAATTVAGV